LVAVGVLSLLIAFEMVSSYWLPADAELAPPSPSPPNPYLNQTGSDMDNLGNMVVAMDVPYVTIDHSFTRACVPEQPLPDAHSAVPA